MINDELPQANGKVFAFNGVEASGLNNFIQDMCFISGVPLFPIIDTGVAHSFIPHDCLNKLNLKVSHIKFNMIIKKRSNGLVVTSITYFNFPLSIYDKDLVVDLIFLPLSQLDVILGLNWLSSSCVHLNCFDKIILFFGSTKSEDSRFIIANQVEISLK